MPRTGAPPITGLMPTTGAAVARSASRMPGIAEDRADGDDRVRRRDDDHVGVGDRLEHAGRRA